MKHSPRLPSTMTELQWLPRKESRALKTLSIRQCKFRVLDKPRVLLEYLYSLIRKTMAKGIDCEWCDPQHAGLPEHATSNSLPPTFPFCTYTAFTSRPQPRLCIPMPLYQSQGSHLAESSAEVKTRQDAMGVCELVTKASRMVHKTPAALASAFLFVCSWKNPLFPKQNNKVSMASASPVWQGHKSQPRGCHV